MLGVSPWAVAVICVSLLTISNSEPTPTSTYSRKGCPTPVGILNGGFDTGKKSPWVERADLHPTFKTSLVSPGYQSKYALKLQFPPANYTNSFLENKIQGYLCPGYYYNISYAWNWLNYTGPEGPGFHGPSTSFCGFSVSTGYTKANVTHYATRTPGWHHHSFVTQQIYHCGKVYDTFYPDVICISGHNDSLVLPGFTILIDDLQITNADRAPQHQPHGTCP